ncbi:hypothetical protein HN748_02435 [Candidatus Peregrinibacteria bacterium]|nr:hypothetical protein [Candidatus Peregrinibacteria bacterium]MBT7484622.1 hypothetical protein [Candidatus Peregrinibacteria bacterium]MBT7703066.1 hypothetical protein [Candidatus Peregrinibacteria bacterium]
MNDVLDEIDTSDSPIIVFSRSQPKLVVMSIETFEKRQKTTSVPKDDYPFGADFFINPPEEFIIKKGGLDAVKLIRELRD